LEYIAKLIDMLLKQFLLFNRNSARCLSISYFSFAVTISISSLLPALKYYETTIWFMQILVLLILNNHLSDGILLTVADGKEKGVFFISFYYNIWSPLLIIHHFNMLKAKFAYPCTQGFC